MYDAIFIALYVIMLLCIVSAMIVVVILAVRLSKKHKANRKLMEHAAEMGGEVLSAKAREGATAARFEVQRKWYCHLLDCFPDIFLVCAVDEDGTPGRFVEANKYACDYLGYTKEELLGKTLMDIQRVDIGLAVSGASSSETAERERAVASRVMRNMLKNTVRTGKLSYEAAFRNRDGEESPVLVEVKEHSRDGKPMLVFCARDLRDARREQIARQESERRMSDLFRYSPLGIALYSRERRITTVNPACLSMFGVLNEREFEQFNLFDPPFIPQNLSQRLKNGENVSCEMVVNFDEVRDRALFISRHAGVRYYNIYIGTLGKDKAYVPLGYFVQSEDITEQRLLENQLRQFQVALSESKSAADGISGSLKDVHFVDMIQILSAGDKGMQLDLKRDGVKAQVVIIGGEVVHCHVDDQLGEEAFYHLMKWREGEFTAKRCDKAEKRTVTSSTMSLLMEGARRMDEV